MTSNEQNGGAPLGEPLYLRAWLALPESRGPSDAAALWLLIAEAAELLLALHPDLVLRTSEPRSYRVASGAWLAARPLLEAERLHSLYLGTPLHVSSRPEYGAELYLTLRTPHTQDVPIVVDLHTSAVLRPPRGEVTVSDVVALVKRWAVTHAPSQGFVSTRSEVVLARTTELRTGILGVVSWTATQRFLKMFDWGTVLGPKLCASLGGPEAVLADAPAWRAERLGDGVFLQLTPSPDELAPLDRWTAMLEYLRPLLPTERDTIPGTRARGVNVSPAPTTTGSGRRGPRLKPGFPVQILAQEGVDATFNLYFRSRPSAEVERRLTAALDEWFQYGFHGGYGEAGFHGMTRPMASGRAVRWHVDMGTADGRRAIGDLAARLEALSRGAGAPIERLTVGEEVVE